MTSKPVFRTQVKPLVKALLLSLAAISSVSPTYLSLSSYLLTGSLQESGCRRYELPDLRCILRPIPPPNGYNWLEYCKLCPDSGNGSHTPISSDRIIQSLVGKLP